MALGAESLVIEDSRWAPVNRNIKTDDRSAPIGGGGSGGKACSGCGGPNAGGVSRVDKP